MCLKQKVYKWPGWQLVFLILRAEEGQILTIVSRERYKILKDKRMLLVYGLRNVPQKFQPSAINRKYKSGQAEQLVLSILLADVG